MAEDELRISPTLGLGSGNKASAENAHAGVQMMGIGLQGKQQAADAAKQVASAKFTVNPLDDTVKYEGPAAVVRSLLESKQKVDQYQNLYNDLIAQNLQKQQQMREHPFANTMAELAASFARNDPNPYTRAVGQAATRLNPSMQELQQEEQGLLKNAEGFAMRREVVDAGLMRTQEFAEQKKEANFTRLLGTFQQMSKGGMKDEKAYLSAAKKLGVDEETAKDLAGGFVKEAQDADAVRTAKQKFTAEQKNLDREVKMKIAQGHDAVGQVRNQIYRSKVEFAQAVASGQKLDVPKMMNLRVKLLSLRSQLEQGAVKSFNSVQGRIADANNKYLGVSAMDRDGSFKTMLDATLNPMQNATQAGLQAAQAHMEEIDQELAKVDSILAQGGRDPEFADVIGGSSSKQPVPAKPKKQIEEPNLWQRITGDSQKKAKTKSGTTYEILGN
jgi:hypothetical protein